MVIHSLHSVVLDDTSDTVLGGMISGNATTGLEQEANAKSGEAYVRHRSVIRIGPSLSFTTKNVKEAYDAIGLTGLNIGGLATGIVAYLQQHDQGGLRVAGSTHLSYTYKHGLLRLGTLSVSHRAAATLSVESAISFDGTNTPVIEAATVALPTLPAQTEYTLDDAASSIGGVSLSNFRDISVDFGVVAQTEGTDSAIYDTFAGIYTIMPIITASGIDPEWLKSSNIPLGGLACTHANTILYLRKRAHGGQFVADGTAEHIKITAAGIANIESIFESSSENVSAPTTTGFVLHTHHDGTNTPLVFDTASAIT